MIREVHYSAQDAHTWSLDSGTIFHVTPKIELFSKQSDWVIGRSAKSRNRRSSHPTIEWQHNNPAPSLARTRSESSLYRHASQRRETYPKSTISPLRDSTIAPRTDPYGYMWVDAREITRRPQVLHHLLRWLHTEGLSLLSYVERRSTHGLLSLDSRSGEPNNTPSEDTHVRQRRRIHLLSLQIVPLRKRNPAPKDRSLHTYAKWSGKTDEPDDPREGDCNALALQIKAGILGRSIVDGSVPDKSITVESNQARSATSTMVRKRTDLW